MTDNEFRQQYRLVKLITDQGTRTYHALDSAGRGVLVHYLPSAAPDAQRLLTLLDSTPAAARQVLQRVEVDGAPVIVTEPIADFRSLAAWLQSFPPSRPAPPSAGRGEMTALFGAVAAPPAAKQPQTPPPAPPPPTPPPRRAPAMSEEATLIVDAVTERRIPSAPAPPPPAPAPPAPPALPPQEKKPAIRWREPSRADAPVERPVVRWKEDVPPPPPPAPPAPKPQPPAPAPPPRAAAPKPAGEFTQLFGPGSGSGAAAESPPVRPPVDPLRAPAPPPIAPVAPPAPAAPAFGAPPRAEPGEFTRLFNPERSLEAAPPPPPARPARDLLADFDAAVRTPAPPTPPAPRAPSPAPAAGEFTRMLGGLPAGQPAPGAPPPAPAAAPASSGPGEFTRVIKGLSAPRAAAPAPASSPDAAEEPEADEESPRSRRVVVLVVGLGLVAVLVIALILYFVLRAP